MTSIDCTFLIIGGGIAGVSAAEQLAFLCPNEKTILLTESSLIKAVTNLVKIGKSLHRFDIHEIKAQDFNTNVTVLTDSLKSIDSEHKKIITNKESVIAYQFLCLCTGAKPKLIVPDNPYVIGIRDTDSIEEFQKRVKSGRKLVVVGNGGIASELVYEIENIKVDWIVKDHYISSTFVDSGAAEFFQAKLLAKNLQATSNEPADAPAKAIIKRMRYSEDDDASTSAEHRKGAALGPDWHRRIDLKGNIKNIPESIKIHYDSEIKNVSVNNMSEVADFPLAVELMNGETLNCDFLLSATGVVPVCDFACDKELRLGPDGGIHVDELMRTSIPQIYAAGDCCYAGWEWTKNWFQMRLWTQARQMGAMAGRSMAAALSGEESYQDFCFELFGHVTTLFGYQVVLLGKYNGQDLGNKYEVLVRITPEQEYVKFVLVDGKLQGAILVGDTGLEETVENLILNQLDVTPYGDDLLNPDIDIEDYFD
jgi:pyridine nucleotide-disulfide oxidoreductase domain-containing protein 1